MYEIVNFKSMIKIKSTTNPSERIYRPYCRASMKEIIDFWTKENSFINTELYLQILRAKTTHD